MNWTIIYLNLIQMKSCILHFLISSPRRNVLSLLTWPSDLLYSFIDYTLESAWIPFEVCVKSDGRWPRTRVHPWSHRGTLILASGGGFVSCPDGKVFQGLADSMGHHTVTGKLTIHGGLICCVHCIEWAAIWSLVACVLILGFSLISCVTLGKVTNIPLPWFSHLCNGDYNTT